MRACVFHLDIRNPSRMEVGIDTSSSPATIRTEALSNDPKRFHPRGLRGAIFGLLTSRKTGIVVSIKPAAGGLRRSCTWLVLRRAVCIVAMREHGDAPL